MADITIIVIIVAILVTLASSITVTYMIAKVEHFKDMANLYEDMYYAEKKFLRRESDLAENILKLARKVLNEEGEDDNCT